MKGGMHAAVSEAITAGKMSAKMSFVVNKENSKPNDGLSGVSVDGAALVAAFAVVGVFGSSTPSWVIEESEDTLL